ncbi:hypothetical protein MTO98_22870 [Mucilaginibacter sp. SMC90]|uniref:hypothetical protein n=1 Tax=Mucilaginibacter sp. SMC90 TaxID=2929803 RepID=UPI001FB1F36B|nr:hypothetical protein [Mucilaginibacter sp. SMC90]UOE47252.1 hypothetical protein MTO98_22870 [Mucilaginibacter sp. SMC90]
MRRIVIAYLVIFFFRQALHAQQTFSTRAFTIKIDEEGLVTSLINNNSKKDYAVPGKPGILLQIVKGDSTISPAKAVFSKKDIKLYYPVGIVADVRVTVKDDYIAFVLNGISSDVDAIKWGPFNTVIADTIGGAVGVVRCADFAIGIQGLNKKTSGGELVNREGAVFNNGTTATKKDFGASLQAFTVNRSKDRKITVWDRWPEVPVRAITDGELKGSSIALFGCKPGMVLPVIKKITLQDGLPYATLKKEWIKQSSGSGKPYLITTFSESNIDTFLTYAKRMGMAGVYHEDPFETWGHFVLKKTLFPHGLAGFKACVDKAHAQGLRLGFHVLTNFLTTNDAYVTPKPDTSLATAGASKITEDITDNATEIAVESPGYFILKSDLNSVRIGDEIIRFAGVSKQAPFKLTGCIRGAFGTIKAAHKANERIARLLDHPYLVFFPDWKLQKQIAANIAGFINETGADQMDFDGHEGTYATGMGDLSFNTFAEDVFKQANHPVVFGSSRANHYFWHINSYLNWGEPWYGGFRESQSDLRISNQKFYEDNYLPNMLGWFLITAQTSADDVDWMLARAAGFNAGYALVVREEALTNPHMDEIIGRINLWTEATNKRLFSAAQRMWLKNPDNDVNLFQQQGKWYMQRYQKYEFKYEARVLQPGQPTSVNWDFENKQLSQVPNIVVTAVGDDGKLNDPVVEIDHGYHVKIPVTLQAGQTLAINNAETASLYDQKGRLIRNIPLATKLPELSIGTHNVLFDAATDANSAVKVKVVIKLLENKELLK